MAFLHPQRSSGHLKNLSKDLNGHMKTLPRQLAVHPRGGGFNTNKTITLYNMATDNVCLSLDTSKQMVIVNISAAQRGLLGLRAFGSSNITGHTRAPDATKAEW